MMHLMTVHGTTRRRRPRTRRTAPRSSAAAARRVDPARCTRRARRQRGLGARSDRRDPQHRRSSRPTRRRASTSSPAWPRRATARLALIEKYSDRHLADRVFELAWTHSQVVLRQLDATEAEIAALRTAREQHPLCQPDAARAAERASPATAAGSRRCGRYGISGDLPDRAGAHRATGEHLDLVRQLVQAHAYWRLKGLVVDLVIWNEDHVGLPPGAARRDHAVVVVAQRRGDAARPAGRHLRAPRRADVGGGQSPHADRGAGRSSVDTAGTLAEQVEPAPQRAELPVRSFPAGAVSRTPPATASAPSPSEVERPRPGRLQRPRRLHARRPRVRHHHRRRSGERRRRG